MNPDWDLPTLRQQVKLVRTHAHADLDYQLKLAKYDEAKAQYDEYMAQGWGNCPGCHLPLRLGNAKNKRICPNLNCRTIFLPSVAKARHRNPSMPREPAPPTMPIGLLGKFFK